MSNIAEKISRDISKISELYICYCFIDSENNKKNKNKLINRIKNIIKKNVKKENININVIEKEDEIKKSGFYLLYKKEKQRIFLYKVITLDKKSVLYINLVNNVTFIRTYHDSKHLEYKEIDVNILIKTEYNYYTERFKINKKEINNIDKYVNNKIFYIIKNIYNNHDSMLKKRNKMNKLIEKLIVLNIEEIYK